MIVSTGYKSKLMNFLTFLEREEIPATHAELSLSDYKLYFRDYKGISMQETKNSKDPMHVRFMRRAVLLQDSFECFRLALTVPRSACMDYILSGTYTTAINMSLTMNSLQDIFIMSNDIDIKWGILWTFPKGSSLTATFDRIKGQALATGLFGKWMTDDFYKKRLDGVHYLRAQRHSQLKETIEAVLQDLGRNGPRPLGVSNTISIFLVLVIGFGLALLLWIAENHQRCTWQLVKSRFAACDFLQRRRK
jgi:hypothetical protein